MGRKNEEMKIQLIDIDSTIPNLALHKIERYHLDRGDEVLWNFPLLQCDQTYVSCIYTKNAHLAEQWASQAIIGGSGYDLKMVLPPEIEAVKPKINLGFTTRGCIRKCKFCIVPEKEGPIRAVGDLLDLWDGKSRDIILLDNNILALLEHFKLICQQAIKSRIRLDFNQGLDHRLLTNEIADLLHKIPHVEYKFAFDHPSYLPTIQKALSILKNHGINKTTWYVLVGFDTTFKEDLDRLYYLKTNKQNAFVQRYETCYYQKKYIQLARWANQHHIFAKKTFEEFLRTR